MNINVANYRKLYFSVLSTIGLWFSIQTLLTPYITIIHLREQKRVRNWGVEYYKILWFGVYDRGFVTVLSSGIHLGLVLVVQFK